MKKLKLTCFFYFLFILLFCLLFFSPFESMAKQEEAQAPGGKIAKQAANTKKILITADHSKHKALQENFKSGSEVTKACLSCHTEAASQFYKTVHWTWIDPKSDKETLAGKAGYTVNNFCISTNMMHDKECQDCHVGWNGKADGINCLVCHGQKEFDFKEAFADIQYFLDSDDEESKEIAKEIQSDIQKVVQSIGRPTRKTCGWCHFYGGFGGDGCKHGDLDSSLEKANKTLDVHMGYDGQNFQCVRCHTTVLHNIAGRVYSTPASTHRKSLIKDDLTPKITCESCHSHKPHKPGIKANDHTDKVACQSCHIPKFARIVATKVWWDWSKAGKLKDGKPYRTKDPLGRYNYISEIGEMKWAKNLRPEYFWFNGSMNTLTAKNTIDPGEIVHVRWPVGDLNDKNSRIFPFKVHRGKQPYDKVYKTILAPLVSEQDGYWTTLDWQKALTKGMEYMDLPYSGQFDFVETGFAFPITHMVAPKDNVVNCTECHVRKEGRLANLAGFYIPGRDSFKFIDIAGWGLILASLGGVVLHALGRIFTSGRRG